MHSQLKFLTLAILIALLAPVGVVFWRCVRFVPLSDPRRAADLENFQREIRDLQAEAMAAPINPDEFAVTVPLAHAFVESVGPWDSAPSWLTFYPRRWVGVVGLLATGAAFVCGVVLLFLPVVHRLDP